MGAPSHESAKDFLLFVNASPTPFHAVDSIQNRLSKAGFKEIKERNSWALDLRPGGKYYLTRNGSSIVAFAIGGKWKPGNPIAMIGAHTDSPCLRIKPVSKKEAVGFLQVGVETYGGGLWHTWFDRDLSIAGRVMLRLDGGNITQRLVKIDRTVLRVPSLAIHLDRQEPFQFNKESQLFPITGLVAAELGRQAKAKLPSSSKQGSEDNSSNSASGFLPLKALTERHHPAIVELIASDPNVNAAADDIVDFEMSLYDTQKSCIGGLNEELIFSSRLDNLMMTYCTTMALIESLKASDTFETDSSIRLISLFDHEEIGSKSAQGADSNLLPSVIRRLSVLEPSPAGNGKSKVAEGNFVDNSKATAYEQTLASSFLISADMAHSVNPNFVGNYESNHLPVINQGVVIKINANARYATNSPGIVLLQEVAKRARSRNSTIESGVPLQLFVVRNDSSCGSTIGPMLSAALGARTLDLGNAQLSMHSIRETGGVYDVDHAIYLFESFFRNYSKIEQKIIID
ncbi:MAG: hypothetical protein M1829_005318 [Trizodia sp. TS-e1964]|nr:MAG: hypothetical protein M1829_005318 [Trizodia sp. TS-e1964]